MKRPRHEINSAEASASAVRRAVVFPSALGWMSLVIDKGTVMQLSFGHGTPQEALAGVYAATEAGDVELVEDASESEPLVRRLQAYADGAQDDFLDVPVDGSGLTPFQMRVVQICRRIPFGSSLTYGELAARAGHPRAARAVGSCMRTRRVPLIVPCHRVVSAAGATGRHSACEGMRMKLRLLEMKSATGSV
ncbi:MAG TPA: methylated-DNA--[protein]-cysteine S-methyltransferase [Pirellulales bacterium]|nr:methylated-DNA--[protein]-cysteine S-methyltransferase [Pirellulales bacterium]